MLSIVGLRGAFNAGYLWTSGEEGFGRLLVAARFVVFKLYYFL